MEVRPQLKWTRGETVEWENDPPPKWGNGERRMSDLLRSKNSGFIWNMNPGTNVRHQMSVWNESLTYRSRPKTSKIKYFTIFQARLNLSTLNRQIVSLPLIKHLRCASRTHRVFQIGIRFQILVSQISLNTDESSGKISDLINSKEFRLHFRGFW